MGGGTGDWSLVLSRIFDAGHLGNMDSSKMACAVEFGCLKVVNQMSYLTVGSLENTSRLVDVSLNWTINSTG